ncbi:hypothetical protein [Bacteroides sp.]|uniref:hypothetical protein n=1 Tax=Bacteroides sp. TaxID=29523 RepID=UPI002632DA8C|nr:hypothetical protein [Bacteroides sp.]
MNNIFYKLRTIVDKIPKIILITFLLGVIVLIPFPETITGEVTLANFENQDACVIGELPYQYITKLKEGTCVKIELDGFSVKEEGKHIGYITHINRETKETSEGTFFTYTILLINNPFMFKGMKGRASIFLCQKNLLTRAVELLYIP